MKKFLLSILILSSLNLSAQLDPLKESERITAETMREHIEMLASDSMLGRKTGEYGQKKAADYIAKQFQGIGLLPISNTPTPYYQNFYIDKLKDFSYLLVKIDDTDSISGMKNFLFFGKIEFRKPVTLRYEFNQSQNPAKGNGILYRADNLENALTRIAASYDSSITRDYLICLPDKEYKAVLSEYSFLSRKKLIIEQDSAEYYKVIFLKPRKIDSFGIKKILPAFLESQPTCRLIITKEEAVEKLLAPKELKKFRKNDSAISRKLRLRAVNNMFITESMETENVIARIEGADKKEEAIVICGHYDHLGAGYFKNDQGKFEKGVYNGADDNASGTAAVIETAKVFASAAQAGFKPKRTIIFVAFTAEEDGLIGSEYYVNKPIIPIEKTKAVINMDMIGRTNKFYQESDKYVNSMNKRAKCKLKRLNRRNGKLLGLKIDFTPGLKERLLMNFGSDHRPFVTRDIPAIILSTGDHPDYHKPTDDADKINYPRAALIARLAFLDAWSLANE